MSAPASAADLAARPYTKAPPPMVAAIYDWTGFYMGLNGGGGSSHKCWDINDSLGFVIPAFREGCHDATGGVAGGQLGYRWQAANWVFGLEGQGDWANFKGSNVSLFNTAITNQTKIDAFGLFTGQVGYAWNNVLWYVKGGGAVVNDNYRGFVTATNIGIDTASQTRWGGVVGTGLEFGFAPNWSVAALRQKSEPELEKNVMMRNALLAAIGVVALGAAPALAADLAARPYTKAPPVVAPI
jgi:outer membrane immunogenic protein